MIWKLESFSYKAADTITIISRNTDNNIRCFAWHKSFVKDDDDDGDGNSDNHIQVGASSFSLTNNSGEVEKIESGKKCLVGKKLFKKKKNE